MNKGVSAFFLSLSIILLTCSSLFLQYQSLGISLGINTTPTASSSTIVLGSSFPKTNTLATSTTYNASWFGLGPKPLGLNLYGGFSWGVAPFAGRVTAIVVNGSNPSNIYLGAAQGGVWKSLDGGTTWIPLTDNQSSLAIGAITLSPDNKTIYVGTGEFHHSGDSYAGTGLLKSIDGGKTWTTLGANYFNQSAISAVVINNTNPNDILVGTTYGFCCKGVAIYNAVYGEGVFRSTDGGTSWTQVFSPDSHNLNDGIAALVIDPHNQSLVYASDFYGEVFQSIDGGLTFPNIVMSIPASSYLERVAIAAPSTLKNILYAAFVSSTGNLYGIYKYNATNHVATAFASLPSPPNDGQAYGPCNSQCDYDLVLAVDPTNANIIYFGGIDLFMTTNGGSSWTDLGGSTKTSVIHPDQQYLAIDPTLHTTIYIGNDGGIWKSINQGSAWTNLNTNLEITQFNTIAASPFNASILIGGTQDNACAGNNGTTTWSSLTSGDGGWAGFESTNSSIVYCNYAHLDFQKSTDGGQTFKSAISGINTSEYSLFYAPVGQDPNNAGVLYFGGTHLYKTTNFASSWSALPSIISSYQNAFSTITVAPSNSNIVYVGETNGSIFVSSNAGNNWMLNTPPGASTLSISSIAVDSFNSSIAYAITNTAPDGAPRIYTTTNQGVSWSQITTIGLPLSGINIIKINPINKILYAGMDHGVYYSADNGVHWTKVGSGLPNVAVDDLAFTKDNALIAATHGRGVWKYFITPVVTLKNVINTGIYKSGIIIALAISSTTGISQVLYHWDNLANSTFSTLYNVTLPTGDGPHNLTVFVQDTNGVWIKQSFTFLADNIPPSIIITTPANGTTILLTTIINGTVTDLDGIVLLDYHWDNFGNTTIRSLSSIIIPNLSGQHILSIYAQDNAGNWAKAKYTYVIGSISSTPGYDVLVFGISLVCMALVLLFKRRNK